MLIIMIVAVILFYIGLGRFMGKGDRIRGSRYPEMQQRIRAEGAGHPIGDVAGTDAGMVRTTWTALDDLQLNRLLRDSS